MWRTALSPGKAGEECGSGRGQPSLPISWQEIALPGASPLPSSPSPASFPSGAEERSLVLCRGCRNPDSPRTLGICGYTFQVDSLTRVRLCRGLRSSRFFWTRTKSKETPQLARLDLLKPQSSSVCPRNTGFKKKGQIKFAVRIPPQFTSESSHLEMSRMSSAPASFA